MLGSIQSSGRGHHGGSLGCHLHHLVSISHVCWVRFKAQVGVSGLSPSPSGVHQSCMLGSIQSSGRGHHGGSLGCHLHHLVSISHVCWVRFKAQVEAEHFSIFSHNPFRLHQSVKNYISDNSKHFVE